MRSPRKEAQEALLACATPATRPNHRVTRRLSHLLAAITALAVLALPASALADPDAVIRDCGQDGKLDGHYSQKDLREARSNLPTDLDEYSDCREIISAAITSGAGKDGGSKAGGKTDSAPSPAEQNARAGDQRDLAELSVQKPESIDVGGRRVTPGSNGLFDVADSSNGIPTPLLLVLITLGLLSIAGGLFALRSRIPLLARISLPSRDPFRRSRR